jgi:hypothetical protein
LLLLIVLDAASYIDEHTLKTMCVFSLGAVLFKVLYEIGYAWTGGNFYDSWIIAFHAAELTCLLGSAYCLCAAVGPVCEDYRHRL